MKYDESDFIEQSIVYDEDGKLCDWYWDNDRKTWKYKAVHQV